MVNNGDPISRNKRGTKVTTKKRNIKSAKADAVEKVRTYGIDSLNIDYTAQAGNDSVRGEENANGNYSK